MSACRDCGAPVRFVKPREKGRAVIPVDAAPDDKGNVAAAVTPMNELSGYALRRGEKVPEGWTRFMPHQATCAGRKRRGVRRPSPDHQGELFTYETPDTDERHTR